MEPCKIQILFEDQFIIAVDKPSGTPSHTLSDPAQVTVESLLRKQRPELPELAPLHRLDTGTSGVLLFSKYQEVYEQMRLKFKNREIEKHYLAWSRKNGPISRLPLLIAIPLAHHAKSHKRMLAITDPKKQSFSGKLLPAETVIQSCLPVQTTLGEKIFEFSIQIITGVTHQIRVHLAHIGCPLIGDRTYLPLAERETSERLGLHAEKISFVLNGKNYCIASPRSTLTFNAP